MPFQGVKWRCPWRATSLQALNAYGPAGDHATSSLETHGNAPALPLQALDAYGPAGDHAGATLEVGRAHGTAVAGRPRLRCTGCRDHSARSRATICSSLSASSSFGRD